ncbi:hypothetical protein [Streptomyces sp. NPDC102437]|uniref:hypothetical protein n=1 Tax=Streptomyces sp. NPDC102437 TaxID=3366175 RepID=UPI00380B9445
MLTSGFRTVLPSRPAVAVLLVPLAAAAQAVGVGATAFLGGIMLVAVLLTLAARVPQPLRYSGVNVPGRAGAGRTALRHRRT